jgi:hypothetical protein
MVRLAADRLIFILECRITGLKSIKNWRNHLTLPRSFFRALLDTSAGFSIEGNIPA